MSNPDKSSKRNMDKELKHINEKHTAEIKKIKTDHDKLELSKNPELLNKHRELKEKLRVINQSKKQIVKELVSLEDKIHIDKCNICDTIIPIRLLEKCKYKHSFCISHGVFTCDFYDEIDCCKLCPAHVHTIMHRGDVRKVCEFHKKYLTTH